MAVICDEKAANRYVSKVIPFVLLGIVIYASYAVTKSLCIDYLIDPAPSYDQSPRVDTGAAIIAIYYVLLFPAFVTYIRLYYQVIFNPDFTPRGQQWTPNQDHKRGLNSRRRKARRTQARQSHDEEREKNDLNSSTDVEAAKDQIGGKAFPLDAAGLESFYMKDIFVCQEDGRPPYCSKCCQFKTDRAHHCSDVDRCVRKLDHFCPWVGGVVSESSYKYFIQFVFYTAIFCGFALIVLANFTAELQQTTGRVNAQWIVALALSALFFLFSAGMTGSSLHLAATNTTTIENLSRQTKVWTLAINIPRPPAAGPPRHDWAQTFPTVTYPLRPISNGMDSSDQDSKPADSRVFAILQTQPGENPFDLGSPIKNLRQIMGYTIADWLLPLKRCPCADHTGFESAYPMGPVVQRLKREAGLIGPDDDINQRSDSQRSHHHRHRRHHHRRSQHRHKTSDVGALEPGENFSQQATGSEQNDISNPQ